ncbi:MAG TPA: transglycosylase SLT domain-containing protein [Thermoleophilaceae bacterium]
MTRRRNLLVLVALAAAVAALLAAVLGGGDGGHTDPLAFEADRKADFERRAAAGLSHVLYAKSPGGAAASARRTAAWRSQVETAAQAARLDPDLLEAIVLLESAGRPDVIAGDDPEAASGLTQILAETGQNLLGLRVDLAASRSLTKRIAAAERRERDAAAARLRARRRRVDERFDPAKALAATGRYLTIARRRFGRDDLAVASYHMGIGNLERALRAYAGDGDAAIDRVVGEGDLSYARLFFDSTPLLHEEAHAVLSSFGDDSSTYLWRVLAAREIMRLHRENPAELGRLEGLHARKASAEEVLHPSTSTEVFGSPADLRAARADGDLVELPDDPGRYHFAVDRQMGELAARVGETPDLYRALRPEALALLAYMAAGVEEVSGLGPLVVTSTVRDPSYQRVLGRRNREAARDYSLHTTGYSFDVLREYRSREQALAFEFWLGRLQALDLIAWVREPRAIHVTVSSEAERLSALLPGGG